VKLPDAYTPEMNFSRVVRKGSKIPRKRGTGLVGSVHPPQFTSTFIVRRKLRFKATAFSAGDTVTFISLGDLWCNTPTAATGYQMSNYVRIRKIEMWAPMAADLIPVTCSVEWVGGGAGLLGKSNIVSDTSMGSGEPAHVVTRPPAGSQIAEWQTTTGANAFKLVYPANTIIDLSIDFVVRDDASAVAVTGVVAGATVGASYIRALNSSVNNNLVPLSTATI